MTVYLFPGQGSQTKGMGAELFPFFPALTAKADAILGYSIQKLCVEDPYNQLSQTAYTQPALYVVNALSYLKKLQDTYNKMPTFFAGHSLGEYNALFAAGVFDFETGLKLVKKRGELMSQATGGAMAAIIGLKVDVLKPIVERHQVAVANHNSYTQVVISGKKAHVENAQQQCTQGGATLVIPLNVSGAFHSPEMEEAQSKFGLFVDEFHFTPPTLPVIANCTAKPYEPQLLKKTLVQQMTNPVLWTETIEFLLAQDKTTLEEVGPGIILTGLVRRIKNGL